MSKALTNWVARQTDDHTAGSPGRETTMPPVAPSTLKQRVSHLTKMFNIAGIPPPWTADPKEEGMTTQALLIIQGHQRRWKGPTRRKAPVDGMLLRVMQAECKTDEDQAALAATTFGYLTALRGISPVPGGPMFDSDRQLRNRDVEIGERHVTLTIRVEKNQQRRNKARKIKLWAAENPLCPLTLARKQRKTNPNQDSDAPFFQNRDGNPIRRHIVEKRIKKAATKLGRDPALYSLHSPRVGTVNALAEAGFEMEWIRVYGAWTSQAHFTYLRIQISDRQTSTNKQRVRHTRDAQWAMLEYVCRDAERATLIVPRDE